VQRAAAAVTGIAARTRMAAAVVVAIQEMWTVRSERDGQVARNKKLERSGAREKKHLGRGG